MNSSPANPRFLYQILIAVDGPVTGLDVGF
jgi:hypothetical protein